MLEPLLAVGPAMLAALAGYASIGCAAPVASVVVVASIVSTLGCSVLLVRLAQRRVVAERGYDSTFRCAGVAMWREDWSAIAGDVAALVREGVVDLEGYFASRPHELRALRAKVMIEDVNDFAIEETGAEGRHVYLGSLDRLLPDTDQTFVQWLVGFARGDRFYRSETHTIKADGSASDLLFTARLPQHIDDFKEIVVTSFDITQYKAAQERLQRTEHELARASRITTMGALTASIAHEVNSPLAAILANAEAALRWLRWPTPDVAEAEAALAELVTEATRARDVVKRTRDFLANAPSRTEDVDLVRIARDASLIVEREVRALGATVHIQAAAGLPVVRGDPIQLQQVLVNLLINAAQASVVNDGPRDITVSVRSRDGMVQTEVKDVGPGVERARRQSIFDPFHTTKTDGMGMGLAICRDCIEVLGGRIWVEGEPGSGARFVFSIPHGQ